LTSRSRFNRKSGKATDRPDYAAIVNKSLPKLGRSRMIPAGRMKKNRSNRNDVDRIRRDGMEQIIAQLVGGALGGAGGGKAVKSADMGSVGNMLAGAVGGVAGGQLLLGNLLGAGAEAAGGVDLAAMAGNLVGGGIAGLVVQLIVGMIVKRMRGA
jgi:hypothetical protein